ncbi:hypothetical protein AX15_001475 [Amanita polypyramis BW_CC]|nr:hypothetical protein AX15_001475 [Amanita polypyramis BW_CC]
MSLQTSTSASKARVLQKNDDDVVIVSAVRSALTKGGRGSFKDTGGEVILSHVLRAAYERVGLDPILVEDVAVGNALAPAGGANIARMAALHAGIPHTSGVNTLNRQCSSGLAAINQIANEIRSGQIDFGIGAGFESMSKHYGPGAMPEAADELLENQEAEDCLIPMGITSENVAKDFGITREAQDRFAVSSYHKAAAALKAGIFRDEIVPIKTKIIDPKTEKAVEIVVSADEGIRDGVTYESLSKLKPSFTKDGSTHAGNASQVSDGAAAVLLTRRSVAKRLGLSVLGKYVTGVVVGVPPRIMGIGPAFAIPKVLAKTGLNQEEIDFFEINEAFASQIVYCIEKLNIPYDKVNPHGGAIALGHPLGSTGARQVATGLNIAKRLGHKVFVTSMCAGSGMGMAAVFVNEQ